eukprot:scaffold8377_cov58-Phaeocystis_antarctica.AAC.6
MEAERRGPNTTSRSPSSSPSAPCSEPHSEPCSPRSPRPPRPSARSPRCARSPGAQRRSRSCPGARPLQPNHALCSLANQAAGCVARLQISCSKRSHSPPSCESSRSRSGPVRSRDRRPPAVRPPRSLANSSSSPNLSPNLSPHLSPHLSPNQPNPNHNPGPLCRLRARTETRGACVRHRGPRATSVHACDSVAILRHRDSDGARRWRAWHGLAPRARPHHRARHRACCGGAATVVLAASVVRGPAWSKVPRTISRPFSPCAATQRSGSPSPAALALEAI